MYRGLKKNQNYTWLICAAQNMKNISIKNENVGISASNSLTFNNFINFIIKKFERTLNFIKLSFA